MRAVDLIEKKKHGEALTEAEIRFLIQGFTHGTVADYQMSAFAMAVCFQGMDDAETAVLTDAMMRSGDLVDLSVFGALSVDKHSTGGVGDKTTLILAPMVASLGGKMAKMSGRGLGHTGGTVDKLESIPGFCTTLTPDAFQKQVEQIGVAVIGQSGDLTPADKKLYALRDVTATVDSIPLIASSVMSKKLAAGAKNIVLDVKCGSGAFMKTEDNGRLLAEKMVAIGKRCGRNVAALITNMDVPLGNAIGNALEVREAMEVLQGKPGDLREICIALSAQLLRLCHGWSEAEAREKVEEALDSGKAYDTFRAWIAAQGGDLDRFNIHAKQVQVKASTGGFITHMDAEKIGTASSLLGAGRMKKDDTIDPSAGIVLNKKTGDHVSAGEPIAVFYTNKQDLSAAEELFRSAITWSDTKPEPQKLIFDTII